MDIRQVVILGASGSIGRSTLDVLRNLGPGFRLFGLSVHRQITDLPALAREFSPREIVLTDPSVSLPVLPPTCRLGRGEEAVLDLVARPEVDTVVQAVSGAAGLPFSIAALKAGKRLALANKESMVLAGPLLLDLSRKHRAPILPVDSEHSAIFQALEGRAPGTVRRILLTGSGGPFRNLPAEDLERVTPEQARQHPTWNMGAKITVDSATLMNKALEIIEARWLFGVKPEQIQVVIHPQSLIHSMVEFCDGAILAQLSAPDMRLPIQYALTWPDRSPAPFVEFSLERFRILEFLAPDRARFPALDLAYRVLEMPGSAAIVLNAANEVAVRRFLERRISFPAITRCVATCLDRHHPRFATRLEEIIAIDREARELAEEVCRA